MKVTVGTLMEMKAAGEKITMLTAYDTPTARILDEAGVDTLLVGDSMGNVILGFNDTLPVIGRVEDPVLPYAQPVIVYPAQLLRTRWPGVTLQPQNHLGHSLEGLFRQTVHFLLSGALDANCVAALLAHRPFFSER